MKNVVIAALKADRKKLGCNSVAEFNARIQGMEIDELTQLAIDNDIALPDASGEVSDEAIEGINYITAKDGTMVPIQVGTITAVNNVAFNGGVKCMGVRLEIGAAQHNCIHPDVLFLAEQGHLTVGEQLNFADVKPSRVTGFVDARVIATGTEKLLKVREYQREVKAHSRLVDQELTREFGVKAVQVAKADDCKAMRRALTASKPTFGL